MPEPKKISQFDVAEIFSANDFFSGIQKIAESEYKNVKVPLSVMLDVFAATNHHHNDLYLGLSTWNQMFELVPNDGNPYIKAKLDFLGERGITAYATGSLGDIWDSMPVATADSLGGVKVGESLIIEDGVLNINGDTFNLTNYYTKTNLQTSGQAQVHWGNITSKPTTLAGFGITDAYTKTQANARYSQLGHTHTFASLTSKPTTLSGYGITDAYTQAQIDSFLNLKLDKAGGSISGNLTVSGNLSVLGTEFIADVQTVRITDNLSIINYGEAGAGITAGFAGWEADRGTLTNYRWGYDEARDLWVLGEAGTTLQAVATREDIPTNNGFAKWNATTQRFDTELLYSKTDIDSLLNLKVNRAGDTMTGSPSQRWGDFDSQLLIKDSATPSSGVGGYLGFGNALYGTGGIGAYATGSGQSSNLSLYARGSTGSVVERVKIDENGNLIVYGNILATGGITAYSTGSLGDIWASMPAATATTLGGVKVSPGSGLVMNGDQLEINGDTFNLTNYYTKTNLQTSGQAQVHWGNLTSKPTTLAGFGITDAYTKAQVDTSLNGKVSKSGDTISGNLIINGGVTSLTLERTSTYNSNMLFKGSVGEVYVGKGNGNNFAVGNSRDLGNATYQWLYADATGVRATTFVGALSGNASSATELATARKINGTSFNGSEDITTANWGTTRTIAFSGDVTGSSSINGSVNVTTAMTLANNGVTAGTYRSVTVDAKGRVTAGTNPTTLSGYGITDAVTLNTAQTITGLKTFNANIILGVNRYICGTNNYTGVWNVDNLLWRFGSSKVGSITNIRSEKVGIGTDTPTCKLDVNGAIRAAGSLRATSTVDIDGEYLHLHFNNTAVGAKYSRVMGRNYAGDTRLAGMVISGTSANINDVRIGGGTSAGLASTLISFWTAANSSTLTGKRRAYIDNTEFNMSGNIYATGNITGAGEVTAYTASDARLKTNITSLASINALDIINALNPVTYTWNSRAVQLNGSKNTTSINYGLIAQELEQIVPDLIRPIYGDYKTYDDRGLMAIMLQAIKELKSKVDKLENKN